MRDFRSPHNDKEGERQLRVAKKVHCCLHLAVYQVYLKMLRHRVKEERRGYDLYTTMQRDRGGTLLSPYSTNALDIS